MLNKLKSMWRKEKIIGSPIKGEAVSIKEVKDPTFSDEILGKGVAIKPFDGRVVAPCDGVVSMVFDTKHALSITTEHGAELLIHIGLDTVNLKGKFFEAKVNAGEHVKAGTLLLEFDLEKIREEGYDTICPIVVCNSQDFSSVEATTGEVSELMKVLKITL